jgi:hypothetical protein
MLRRATGRNKKENRKRKGYRKDLSGCERIILKLIIKK